VIDLEAIFGPEPAGPGPAVKPARPAVEPDRPLSPTELVHLGICGGCAQGLRPTPDLAAGCGWRGCPGRRHPGAPQNARRVAPGE
jgi:hypothetical protein